MGQSTGSLGLLHSDLVLTWLWASSCLIVLLDAQAGMTLNPGLAKAVDWGVNLLFLCVFGFLIT